MKLPPGAGFLGERTCMPSDVERDGYILAQLLQTSEFILAVFEDRNFVNPPHHNMMQGSGHV